jgi:hypothetical protein
MRRTLDQRTIDLAQRRTLRTARVTPSRCVTALDGTPLSIPQMLDRVFTDGALAALRSGFSAAEGAAWQDALIAGADARGIELSLDIFGGVVLLTDAGHEQRIQADQPGMCRQECRTATAAPSPDQRPPGASAGRHLQVVRGDRVPGTP